MGGYSGVCTYVCRPHHTTDLLHGVQVRTQTTVHRKDLLIDNGGNRQTVETIRKCFPQFDVVSALALIVKPVYTVDGGAFVISSKNEEVLGVLDLVC